MSWVRSGPVSPRQAALLYWQGYSVRQITETLSQKTPTMQSWKLRDAWDDVDLKGDPIVLPNDARLIFLGTYPRHVARFM